MTETDQNIEETAGRKQHPKWKLLPKQQRRQLLKLKTPEETPEVVL